MTPREKILAGQKIYGTMVRIERNPAFCHLAKNAGFDFVMYDNEHSHYTLETLHDMLLMGNALGLAGFVRVPVSTKDHISRTLDTGATGIMAPMTETAVLAQDLVRWSRYPPLGGRGFAGGMAAVAYATNMKHADVMKEANNRNITIAQIETKKSLDNVNEIAAVEGVDVLLVGPNDLSVSLGIPGDLMNPIEVDAIRMVIAACKKHKKVFGLHAGAKMHSMFIEDTGFVMSMSDTDVLATGLRNVYDSIASL